MNKNTENEIGFNFGGSALFLRISNEFTTKTEFTNWLNEHRPELYGRLATPETINLGKLSIRPFKGINHIELLSNLDTTYSLTYYKDYQSLVNQILELGGE